MTRLRARLVVQGIKQVSGRDFDKTWARVPGWATKRALFPVAASND